MKKIQAAMSMTDCQCLFAKSITNIEFTTLDNYVLPAKKLFSCPSMESPEILEVIRMPI